MKEETLFVYTDSVGNITRRRLASLTQFKAKTTDHIYFKGFDLDARAMRTFRADRMQTFKGDMSDEYWQDLLVESPSVKNEQNPDNKLEVLFTGFPRKDVKPHLESLANKADLLVRKSFTSKLGMLVCGNRAGPKKIEKAQKKGIYILSEEEFICFLDTGEVPGIPEKSSNKTPTPKENTPKAEIPVTMTHLDKPKTYFNEWVYTLVEAHWGALGVNIIYPIDTKKTQYAKQQWDQNNPEFHTLYDYFSKKIIALRGQLKKDKYLDKLAKIPNENKQELNRLYQKITAEIHETLALHPDYNRYKTLKAQRAKQVIQYRTYGYQTPPNYDFHEGDVFYHKSTSETLQVIGFKEQYIEVKHDQAPIRTGYHIYPEQLAAWLKSDTRPDLKYQIDKNQSVSEITKLYEYTK